VVLICRIGVLALAYSAAGSLGLSLAHYHDNATLAWPPSGIALGALLLYGVRLWPGIFLGTLLLSVASQGVTGLAAVGVAIGNTLEAVVGALLLSRVADFRPTLERVRDVAALLFIGALGCTTVSPTVGIATLALTHNLGTAEPGVVWLIWWLGNLGGVIIMTPFLLASVHGTPPWRSLARNIEFWLAALLLASASTWSLGGGSSGPLGFVSIFLPFPLAVWAGIRLGSRGAVLVSFSIMAIATIAMAREVSPFIVEGTETSIAMLWAYGMTIGATALTLAATTAQRDAAERRYRDEEGQRRLAERAQLLMKERERITREMHDGLGGQLVSTIAMVERGSGSRAEVVEELRRALDDMRIVIDTLDPYTTDLPASLGMLRARIAPLLRRNDIALRWEVTEEPGLESFSPEESLHVLRIIQEAVTNAMRHADAEEIAVSLALEGGTRGALSIEIHDDGRGPPRQTGGGGRGLRNMKARAEALGGDFALETGDPGARIRVRIPISD
jgi:signal transduction histidine kinase